jgi:hypothetical protein
MLDRSETWVSQVERGVRRIDRMTVLRRVAETLEIPLNELAADTPVVAAVMETSGPTHELRLLLSSSMALGFVVRRPGRANLRNLNADVERAWGLAHAADSVGLVSLLVELLPRLEAASRVSNEKDRATAYVMLARAYQACAAVLAKQGEIEAAWVAADRAIVAAEHARDPLLMAAGAFRLVLVFQADRRHDQVEHTARTAVEAIEPLVRRGDATARSMAGALRLQLAVAAARVNEPERARAELTRARVLAEANGEDRNDYDTEFGPTNVRLHEIAVAVELGEAGTALRVAASIDARTMSPERQSRLLIDVARAHLQRRNVSGVVSALVDAERLTPEHVHTHRLVKNILYDVARSEHRTDPRVRGLARRCGVHVR